MAAPMSTPSPARVSPEDFESALQSVDDAVRATGKRTRETALVARRLLRKPKSEPFPFHDANDVLSAALEAVSAVTGLPSPPFDLQCDPRRVFEHVRDAVIKYGDECREEGKGLEREHAEPRIQPGTALEALTLMTRLNSILSAPPTA